MAIVNKPKVSKAVAWSYGGLTIFIGALAAFFAYAGFYTPLGAMGFAASMVSAMVEAIIITILRSLYKTRYILEEGSLIIKTTRLIGGEKRIPLDAVKSVEKTLIPFGLRLFGASFHGGYYKIPGLGRAFLAITNFNDGVLIKTKQGNYIITPSNPLEFKRTLKLKTFQL